MTEHRLTEKRSEVLLDVRGLKTHFFTDDGVSPAVDGVDLHVHRGETLGIVGESGCGKSVTALSIMRLIPTPPGRIVGGEILLEGADLLALSADQMRQIRGNRISHDLPGADDLPQPGLHHRQPDHGRRSSCTSRWTGRDGARERPSRC